MASSCVRVCRGTLSVILGAHLIGSGSRPDVSMDCGSGLVDRPSASVCSAIRWVTVDGSRSASIVELASLCMDLCRFPWPSPGFVSPSVYFFQ